MEGKPYNPTLEDSNQEQVVAAHWECLRRNADFREVARQWVEDRGFRFNHALTPDYHDLGYHTPRCALDWMLSSQERVELAENQIKNKLWFSEANFNFGPIESKLNFRPSAVNSSNWKNLFRIEPLINAPDPIRLHMAWNQVPPQFQNQFQAAFFPQYDFSQMNEQLRTMGAELAEVGKFVGGGHPLDEGTLGDYLFGLGRKLRDLSEFCVVFQIPRQKYSKKGFDVFLRKIREAFKSQGLYISSNTYDRHKSFYGTAENWTWFLQAETHKLDVRKSKDALELARLYTEEKRRQAQKGDSSKGFKAHGFRGTPVPSNVLKARRTLVKKHVRAIEVWIKKTYPKVPFKASLKAPSS